MQTLRGRKQSAVPKQPHMYLLVLLVTLKMAVQGSALFERAGNMITHVTSTAQLQKLSREETPLPAVACFYSPGCPHCQRMEQPLSAAAKRLQGLARVFAIDCSVHSSLCAGVQGVPTLSAYPVHAYARAQPYSGDRTEDSLVQFGLSHLPSSYVSIVTSTSEHASLVLQQNTEQKPRVIVLSEKPSPTPIVRALSTRFRRSAVFYQSSTSAVHALYGVTSAPSVFVLPGNASSVLDDAVQYKSSSFTVDRLAAFVAQFAHDPLAPSSSSTTQHSEGSAATPKLKALNATSIGYLFSSPEAAVVSIAHTSKSECQDVLRSLAESLDALERSEIASAYQLDASSASASSLASQLHAQLPPLAAGSCASLVAKPLGKHANPIPFGSGFITNRTANAPDSKRLGNFVFEQAPEECVSRLADNIEANGWLQAATLEQISIALITEKEDPPALFRHLACSFVNPEGDASDNEDDDDDDKTTTHSSGSNDVNSKLRFAMVPAGEAHEFMQRLGNPTPPAVFAFMHVQHDSSGEAQLAVDRYRGKIQYNALKQFVQAALQQVSSSHDGQDDSASSASSKRSVRTVSGPAEFNDVCISSGKPCVLALLDSRRRSHEQDRETFMGGVTSAAGAADALSVGAIDDAHRQPQLLQTLNLGEADLPFVTVLSYAKSLAIKLKGAYSKESIKELLESVVTGRRLSLVATMESNVRVDSLPVLEGGEALQDAESSGVAHVEDEPPLDEVLGETVQTQVPSTHGTDEL